MGWEKVYTALIIFSLPSTNFRGWSLSTPLKYLLRRLYFPTIPKSEVFSSFSFSPSHTLRYSDTTSGSLLPSSSAGHPPPSWQVLRALPQPHAETPSWYEMFFLGSRLNWSVQWRYHWAGGCSWRWRWWWRGWSVANAEASAEMGDILSKDVDDCQIKAWWLSWASGRRREMHPSL